jgi:hypothetical protein
VIETPEGPNAATSGTTRLDRGNVRTGEVLIDRESVQNGAAASGTPGVDPVWWTSIL